MRERHHATAGKQTLAEQADGALAPVVGKHTLAEELGDGEALPHELQLKFSRSLRRDMSGVRVHASPKAAVLADKLKARAFTIGTNVIFGANQYNPHTDQGRSLIAHEVAHAAQQGPAIEPVASGPHELTKASAAAEVNADRAAANMLAGIEAMVTPQPIAIAAKGNDESLDPIETTAPAQGANNDETIGELTAERVGEEPLENGVPLVEKPETQGEKQNLAGLGGKLAGDVHAMPAGGDAPPRAGGGEAVELAATLQEVQREAREGAAAADAESVAFKAEMKAEQTKFDAEQQTVVLDSLKKMSPKDKRATLADLGYDPKALKKLKDSELDDVITGKLEAENRRGKILGMEPDELAKLGSSQKLQFLCDLGIDRKDLEKAGTAKCDKLFADIIKASKVPGQQKVKVQIKGGLLGKSWVVTVKVDDAGVDISAKKEGGFLSKLAGWVKAALPVILTVLAPITGGVSLIALSVYQTVVAIKTGDWLGAIVGAAGAFAGIGALNAIKNGVGGLATAFTKIGQIANKVKTAAGAAQAALAAAKAKNPGSLLAALAGGAAKFATLAGAAAGKFATTMNTWAARLQKWSAIATGGQKVVQGIKAGDPLAALAGGFETAGAVTGGNTAKAMQRASTITTYVNTGRRALQEDPPNYAAVADAALGIAGQLHQDRRLDDAQKLVQRANALRAAWNNRNADPAALANAAFALAESIAVAKYDLEHDANDKDGKPVEDKERDALVARYQRNTRIVASAGAAIKAVSSKPPSYTAALAAFGALSAELTDDKRIDAASELAKKMDRWTQAVRGGDEKAILEAGIAFGQAIDDMRTSIETQRDQAKQEAEKALPPGETLPPGEIDKLPPGPSYADLRNSVPGLPKDAEKDPTVIDGPQKEKLTYSHEVYVAQTMLLHHGFTLAADGLLGEATRTALASFQRAAKPPLRVTGALDAATFERLASTNASGGITDAEDTKTKAELALLQRSAESAIGHANDTIHKLFDGWGPKYGAGASVIRRQLETAVAALGAALTTSRTDPVDAVANLRRLTDLVNRSLGDLMNAVGPEISERDIAAAGAEIIVWTTDTTFEAFARRVPAIAVAYGFLRYALPIAIHEQDLSKALVHGLGGAAAMFVESRKINTGKLADVIAKAAAHKLSTETPKLIDRLGQIRANGVADFARQAEPIVADACKEVTGSILGELLSSLLPQSVEPTTESLKKEMDKVWDWEADHLRELVEKLVENALETGVESTMAELYEKLERARAAP